MAFKIAFIGGSVNSAVGKAHKISAEMDGLFKLSAGCFSHNQEQNNASAAIYGIESSRRYPNYRELVESEKKDIDLFIVLTPTDQHYSQILELAPMGIPIVCEKTITRNVQEALHLKQVIGPDQNKFFRSISNYTGYPMVEELKAIVSSGTLGNLCHIHCEMPQETYLRVDLEGKPIKPQDWRLEDDNRVPTISLDLGIHIFNLIDYITEERPLKVTSTTSNHGNFKGIADSINCISKYTNNLDVNIWYGKTALGHRNGLKIRIYGNKGSLEWEQSHPEIIRYSNTHGCSSVLERGAEGLLRANRSTYNRFKAGHPSGFIEAFANYYQKIYQDFKAFKEGNIEYNAVGIDKSIEGLKFLEAIQQSSAEERWITL